MPLLIYARFRYRRAGFTFTVYPDQVVVTTRRRLTQTTTVHPIAHIARVEIKGAPARLHIVMQDGTSAAYELVGHVAAAYDAIASLRTAAAGSS